MKTLPVLSLLSLCLSCFSASAQDASRFEISASGFAPETELSMGGNATVSDGSSQESFSGGASVDNRAHGAQLEMRFHMTPRQHLDAQAYRVSGDRSYAFDELESITDTDTGTVYTGTATGDGRFDSRFSLYSLSYGYDIIRNDRLVLTPLIGIYSAHLDASLQTSGSASLTDGTTTQVQDLAGRVEEHRHAFAPGFGLSGQFAVNDQWSVRARLQGFRTQWGDFGSDGRFFNAQATVNYAIDPHWSAFAGYDWFDLRLEDDFTAQPTVDETTYTVQGPAHGRLRVHGPLVGARYSF